MFTLESASAPARAEGGQNKRQRDGDNRGKKQQTDGKSEYSSGRNLQITRLVRFHRPHRYSALLVCLPISVCIYSSDFSTRQSLLGDIKMCCK